MPIINIPFPHPINVSVQVRDMVYAVPVTPSGTLSNSFKKESLNQARELGWIIQINNQEGLDPNINPSLDVVQTSGNMPTVGDFIMFAKSRAANTSGILGYYAEATLKNYSTKDIELFSVGTGISISSN